MNVGHFYFLTDAYFVDFPDTYLERNKETINGKLHGRPCFYSFQDDSSPIYWMIPFSSKVEKYRKVYNDKISRSGICDTIVFGDVLGYEKAFLIQNLCPVISKYVRDEYITSGLAPVRISGDFEVELIQKAKKVLALTRHGQRKLVFPDILEIEQGLIRQLSTPAS